MYSVEEFAMCRAYPEVDARGVTDTLLRRMCDMRE